MGFPFLSRYQSGELSRQSLAALQTALAAKGAGADGYLKQGTSKIGLWRYDGAASAPLGPIDLTKASWGYATVASVAGADVTVDASPTLGTSGTLRAWDVSAGASLGDVAYTRTGTTVTLAAGALGSLAAGDVLYEVVGGRTGALDIAAAGEIRPLAGASVQPRAAGLTVQLPSNTKSGARLHLLSAAASWLQAGASLELEVSAVSLASGAYVLASVVGDGSEVIAGGIEYTAAGTYYRSICARGSIAAPVAVAPAGAISIGDWPDVVSACAIPYGASGLVDLKGYGSLGTAEAPPSAIGSRTRTSFGDIEGVGIGGYCPAGQTSLTIVVSTAQLSFR